MRGGAPIGLAAGLMLLPEVSFAAPAGMLNKTVSVTTEIAIPARADSGQTLTARRSIQKVMYISSAGRVFSRTGRQAGRARETTEVAPAAKDGAPRIEGTLAVTTASVNLDEILAMAGTSAYATSPTTFDITPTTTALNPIGCRRAAL